MPDPCVTGHSNADGDVVSYVISYCAKIPCHVHVRCQFTHTPHGTPALAQATKSSPRRGGRMFTRAEDEPSRPGLAAFEEFSA